MDGVQVIIINDVGDVYTPVLDFRIYELHAKIDMNPVLMKISTMINFSANYYNTRVTGWEPVIESIGFNIDIIKN